VLVIAPANSDDSLDGTTVSLQMRVKGVFALSLLGIAGTIILAGFSVFFFMRWWASRIRPPKKDAGRPDGSGLQERRRPSTTAGHRQRTRLRDAPAEAGRKPAMPHSGHGRAGTGDPADLDSAAGHGKAKPRLGDGICGTGGPSRGDGRVLGTGLVLSGCANMPIAKPSSPDTTPYERTRCAPVRPGSS
jgi:hypothetical protein